jgi:hypothetical protein
MKADSVPNSESLLRLIAQNLAKIEYPDLIRPPRSANSRTNSEIVKWGSCVYSCALVRHLSALLNGVVTLHDARNTPAARIVARSCFELGAHAYYVKKHLKQHMEKDDWQAAWNFLTPITTVSRYTREQFPEEPDMFPLPAHISKVINCFREVTPKEAHDDYSYLSEFTHPNTMAFLQHYEWADPATIRFASSPIHGYMGSIVASGVEGLVAIDELLGLSNESAVRPAIRGILVQIAGRDASAKGH